MHDFVKEATAADVVVARLEGGPANIPDAVRVQRVAAHEEKIKVPHQGGYEHFERMVPVPPDGQVVYRWTMRTKPAE